MREKRCKRNVNFARTQMADGEFANPLRVLLAFFESCSSVGSQCPPGITQAPSSCRPNHGQTVGYSSACGA